MGGNPICEDSTYLSNKLRSIYIKVFIGSNIP